ncbi:MAG: S-methyl-5'-thioadenosine phosphorylase [Nanoarchaeota archaeon]
MIKIGIIGGSGLDDPDILQDKAEKYVMTPYGEPSDALITGTIKGVPIVILARHGRKHTIMPSNVNYRANIDALRMEGCTHILATTAVGSLKQSIPPGYIVFLDQFIDRTTKRKSTFYENRVCHIPMADPFCSQIRQELIDTAKELKIRHHTNGTVVTVEGPRFSTKAESNMFRGWNCDVINMSTVPEVVLAREAGICYASIAMSTDYDCWHESEKTVSIGLILETMKENAENVKRILLRVIPNITFTTCSCQDAIKTAII